MLRSHHPMTTAEATLVPLLLLSLAAAAIAGEAKPGADLVVANARV